MGIKERQVRERDAVRRAILDAARDLFVREGYANVSLRKIAERIEYSPAAIYSYFENKSEIFFALAEEGFRMVTAFEDDEPPFADPVEELRRRYLAYYEFSKAHREYYALLFVDRSVPRLTHEWERFGFVGEKLRYIAGVIQRCIDTGAMPASVDPMSAVHTLWAAVHGAAALGLCDRLAPGEDPDALAVDTLNAVLAGLQAGSPLSFKPCDPQPASCDAPVGGSFEEARHHDA
jgi:AcrR family transcriptional regulator